MFDPWICKIARGGQDGGIGGDALVGRSLSVSVLQTADLLIVVTHTPEGAASSPNATLDKRERKRVSFRDRVLVVEFTPP